MEEIKTVVEADGVFFTQGNLKLPCYPDSLERTVYAIDEQPKGVWITLANQNGLSTHPLDEKLLRTVLIGILQTAWYRAYGEANGTDTLRIEKLEFAQTRRMKNYQEAILKKQEELKTKAEDVASGKVKPPKAKKETSALVTKYVLVEPIDISKFKGQQAPILALMSVDKPVTAVQLAEQLAGKITTNQTVDRVVKFYLAEWQKKGMVKIA